MWCLLLLVWACLKRFYKRNEKSLPHLGGFDGTFPGLCFVPSPARAHRCPSRVFLPHYLLPRSLGMDGIPAVLPQFHRFGAIPGQCEAVDRTSRKVDSDCNRDYWRHITIYPAGAATVAGGIISQFSGDHGFSDPRLLFPDWKIFPWAEPRCARRHHRRSWRSFL